MAKDGTRRGGRRVRAGDKPKALSDKIAEGKDADIMEFHAPELDADNLDDAADLTGADMPSPSAYLSAQQKNGKPLGADIVYKETWLWLKQRGCEKNVNKRLLESYSQAFARFGTEYCHTLDAVQINLLLITSEDVHLQVGFRLCHSIILLCQFLTHTLDVVHRLLQGGEEMIEVSFVGIDGKALLTFGLDVQCPPLLVILYQLHIVETDVTAVGYGLRSIQRG